ncbi:MAG: hypothetical protein CMJ23_08380 [Phycisphaerae bacterium]|nr:hypothetical protein [Phycisphaerae bacterium]
MVDRDRLRARMAGGDLVAPADCDRFKACSPVGRVGLAGGIRSGVATASSTKRLRGEAHHPMMLTASSSHRGFP